VTNAENGFLCDVRSPDSLAAAMEAMLRLEPAERSKMGAEARQKVERQFDQALVVKAYRDALA